MLFERNLVGSGENSPAEMRVRSAFDNRVYNSDYYWLTYVVGAFQGPIGEDRDPNEDPNEQEGSLLGATLNTGGSFIFQETLNDASLAYQEEFGITRGQLEIEAVVHEVGHAMTREEEGLCHGQHPVTGFNALEMGVDIGDYSEDGVLVTHYEWYRYTLAYLDWIRSSPRPAGL
jgi:hypothetical protein